MKQPILSSMLALTFLGGSAGVHADGTRPGLNWVRLPGAEQCIGWRELGRRVEARLQRTLFEGPTSADLSLDGHVAAQPDGGFTVRLAVVGRNGEVLGERSLQTREASCRALDDSIVLVIAMTIDPNSRLLDAGIPLSPEVAERLDRLFQDEPAELSAPPPDTTTPSPDHSLSAATSDQTTIVEPERQTTQQPARRWALSVLGAAETGFVPGLSPGLAARLSFQPGLSWTFALRGHWIAPRRVQAPADEPGELRARLVGAGLSACLGDSLGSLRAGLCTGVRLDAATLEPRGFVVDGGTRNDPWLSAQLGAQLEWPRQDAVYGAVGLHLWVPLVVRDYNVVDSAGAPRELLGPGPLAGRLEVGLGFRP